MDAALFGVMSTQTDEHYYCTEQAIWAQPENKGNTNCTSYIDPAVVKKRFAACNNAITCNLNIHDVYRADTPKSLLGEGHCGTNSYVYA